MFGPAAGFGTGPSSVQANAAAGLPHADVPGDLRRKVERVLADEPEHAEPRVTWDRRPPDEGPFGLWRFLRPHRWRLAGAVALVALETVAIQLGPVLTQIGIDRGVVPGDARVLTGAAAAYVGAVAVAAALGAARVSFTGRLGEALMERLRIRVFAHLQRQGIDFFTEERAGVILTRMTSDIEALSVLFQEGIVNLAVQVLTLAVITVLLVVYDPLLALLTLLVAVPPTLGLSSWFRRRSAAGYRRVRDRIADLLSDLQESLAGIRVITAHNRRHHDVVRHEQVVDAHRDANVDASRANAIYAPGSEAIGIGTQAVLLGVGGAMVAAGRITVGELAAYLLFLTSFFAPIQALVQLYNNYQQGGAAIAKLRELLATEPSVPEAPAAVPLPPVEGRVEFDGVWFAYRPGEPVLRGIDLTIEAGETIAFVGETGAGKSTIARLVARFHDASAGAVRIDGHDVRDVTLTSLRRQLGIVPQEPFLFAGTIRDNIAFARPETPDDELLAACEAVGIAELVERLGGLDAPVHERGASLSAGERQLLALTRAFVARPRILVLDEATSNLDLASEARVEQALDVLLSGRTALVIAHRLATARRADRIAVVDAGRIVELGTHDELVAAEGR
ncbi:MAG: ABC transporter ATP-binding protein, partial [Actinomyces sp.]